MATATGAMAWVRNCIRASRPMAASTKHIKCAGKRTENIADLKWLVVGDKIAKAAFWRIYNFNLPAPQIVNG
jgi:hypothetical protein